MVFLWLLERILRKVEYEYKALIELGTHWGGSAIVL